MKRTISRITIIFLLLLSVLPFLNIEVQASSNENDFTYTTSDQKVTITNYNGIDKNVEIPSTINGNPVTTIAEKAFFSKALTTVTIPKTVTTIEANAFASNQLTSAKVLNRNAIIGDDAFSGNGAAFYLIGYKNSTAETYIENKIN